MAREDDEVEAFLAAIPDAGKREDSRALCRLMAEATGEPPRMWGTGMVGFGRYHYEYASGREGEAMAAGFAPRKTGLTLYMMDGFADHAGLLARLGKHSTAKACLYVKRLEDVDPVVLADLVERSYRRVSAPAFGRRP